MPQTMSNSNLDRIVAILKKDRSEAEKETKIFLVSELRSMAEFSGAYTEFAKVSTPIMVEIWKSAADYLEAEI